MFPPFANGTDSQTLLADARSGQANESAFFRVADLRVRDGGARRKLGERFLLEELAGQRNNVRHYGQLHRRESGTVDYHHHYYGYYRAGD
jgi:hypothetical protein